MLSSKARALLEYERAHPKMDQEKLAWLSENGWSAGRHAEQIARLLLDTDVMAEFPDLAARSTRRYEHGLRTNRPRRT
ncbi:hypothetical protein [Pseudoclavibacter sp. JSM 162008]|uniref:hypothetical protein n=1 Tax=Pseudoclavibacter sp. JSM 162008 TaxID=3229855 RepID=UPI00352414CA